MEKFDLNAKEETDVVKKKEALPYHAVDPDTGLVESFETQAEMQKYIEDKQEKRKES
ncbi:MAG: hypothetical protein HYU81_01980 [Candidatus Brennerbacteria bacterium]|nr:hypothetical protein [Candidatus Brennerbacteria bacterium]